MAAFRSSGINNTPGCEPFMSRAIAAAIFFASSTRLFQPAVSTTSLIEQPPAPAKNALQQMGQVRRFAGADRGEPFDFGRHDNLCLQGSDIVVNRSILAATITFACRARISSVLTAHAAAR